MAEYPKIVGLGHLSWPLEVVDVEGSTRLLVTPVGAIGTDTLLLGTGTALLFGGVKSVPLRILGGLGAGWATIAIAYEVAKLIRGPLPGGGVNIIREEPAKS